MSSSVSARRRSVASGVTRIGLVLAALGALLITAASLGRDADATAMMSLGHRILAGVILSAVILGVIALLMHRVDHRPVGEAGLTSLLGYWRHALWGFLGWLAPAAVAFAVLALLGMPLTVSAEPSVVAVTVGLLLLAVLLTEALPEEAVFRGYVTMVLGERLRGWWIITTQALLFTAFAAALRGDLNVMDLSLFASMGIGIGYLRMLTGSIWLGVGFHTAFQTGAQLVLTHEVVEFHGGQVAAMFALGVIPFTVAAIVFTVLAGRLAVQEPRVAGTPAGGAASHRA